MRLSLAGVWLNPLATQPIGRLQPGGGKTMSSDLEKHSEERETVGQKLDTLSAAVDGRFDIVNQQVDTLSASVDERFATLSASVDRRFDAVDLALVEQRQYTEFAFARLDSRFDRFERKLDQFIDTQSTTNKLVERRLTALEPRSDHE
jgi:hypothetical protein